MESSQKILNQPIVIGRLQFASTPFSLIYMLKRALLINIKVNTFVDRFPLNKVVYSIRVTQHAGQSSAVPSIMV